MHGIVHRALEQYVTARTTEDGWDTVRERAGVENRLYLPVSEYPDEEVLDILSTLADLTDHSEETIRRDFGRFFAPSLLETFDAIVDDWGAVETVLALEVLYPRIVTKEGEPESTEIATERSGPDGAVVYYRSPRPLHGFLEGLVEGIGEQYETTLSVDLAPLAPTDGPGDMGAEGDSGAEVATSGGTIAEAGAGEDDRDGYRLTVRVQPD